MGITILVGNVVINRWGYRASELAFKNNVTVNQNGSDFVCISDDNDTDTVSFDIHIPSDCEDAFLSMQERYDRLAHVVKLANRYLGHLQYRYMFDGHQRIWEIISGTISQKDLNNKYARRGVLGVELELVVRKSIQPTMQLFPVRAVPAITDFDALWDGAESLSTVLVTPESSMFTEWSSAATLGDVSALHEITNTGYARLELSGIEDVSNLLWPVQPIVPLLPRVQTSETRRSVICNDFVWVRVTAGDSIGGIVIIDDSDNILGWIPYTNWAYGDLYTSGIIVPDGGVVKFKVNQLGLIIAP